MVSLTVLLVSLLALGFGLLCTKQLAEWRRSKLPTQQQPVVQLGLPVLMTYDAVEGRCVRTILRTPAPLSALPQPHPQQEERQKKQEEGRRESEEIGEQKQAEGQEEQRSSLPEEERIGRRAPLRAARAGGSSGTGNSAGR